MIALRTKVLRGMCLVVGALVMMYSGSITIFSVYTDAVKKKYNYTQTEVEIISGVSTFGAYLGIVYGPMVEKLGLQLSSIVTIMLSLSGYLLLWSATKMADFYSRYIWLHCIYFFLAYSSSMTSYMIALLPNIANFPQKYRGTINGLLLSMFGVGSSISVAIYGAYFVNSHVEDEENQDLGGFFITMAITAVVVNSAGFIFLRYYRVEDISISPDDSVNFGKKKDDSKATEDNALLVPSREKLEESAEDITGIALLKNLDFHMLFLTFVLAFSVPNMFTQNINVYLKSFGLEKHSTLLNILPAIFSTVGELACGVISDVFIRFIPRTVTLLLCNAFIAIVLAICIFIANNFYVMVVTTIIIGVGMGANDGICATSVGDYFGLKHFGANWGVFQTASALFTFVIQLLYGVLYDAAIQQRGEKFCYGMKCFYWSFLMLTILVAISVLCNIVLIKRRYRRPV